MHTRRLTSFLLGAWMLGILIFGFVASQNLANVDRVLSSPPAAVAKDIEDLGSDITRLLLRYQANELIRFFSETWGVAQVGLGAAILSACIFTAHRSKFLIAVTIAMIAIALMQVGYLRPTMNAMSRAFDFLPLSAASRERDNYESYNVINIVLEVLKLLCGFSLTARLLFDRYGWKTKLLPDPPARLQRKRKRSIGGSASGTDGVVDRRTPKVGVAELDGVDDTNDGHING